MQSHFESNTPMENFILMTRVNYIIMQTAVADFVIILKLQWHVVSAFATT